MDFAMQSNVNIVNPYLAIYEIFEWNPESTTNCCYVCWYATRGKTHVWFQEKRFDSCY